MMGYNALVIIRNSQLSRIEADPEFGRRLAENLTSSRWDAGKNKPERTWQAESHTGYRFDVTAACHSDYSNMSMILGGELQDLNDNPDALAALSGIIYDLGFDLVDPAGHAVIHADLPYADHAEWSHHWSEDAFNEGVTSITVLLDAKSNIRDDDQLGPRLGCSLRNWWKSEALLHQHSRSPQSAYAGFRPRNDPNVRAGNHGNPLSIIGVSQPDRNDLVVVGQNLGRMVRPYMFRDPSAREDENAPLARIYRKDVLEAVRLLTGSGYVINKAAPRSDEPRDDIAPGV